MLKVAAEGGAGAFYVGGLGEGAEREDALGEQVERGEADGSVRIWETVGERSPSDCAWFLGRVR